MTTLPPAVIYGIITVLVVLSVGLGILTVLLASRLKKIKIKAASAVNDFLQENIEASRAEYKRIANNDDISLQGDSDISQLAPALRAKMLGLELRFREEEGGKKFWKKYEPKVGEYITTLQDTKKSRYSIVDASEDANKATEHNLNEYQERIENAYRKLSTDRKNNYTNSNAEGLLQELKTLNSLLIVKTDTSEEAQKQAEEMFPTNFDELFIDTAEEEKPAPVQFINVLQNNVAMPGSSPQVFNNVQAENGVPGQEDTKYIPPNEFVRRAEEAASSGLSLKHQDLPNPSKGIRDLIQDLHNRTEEELHKLRGKYAAQQNLMEKLLSGLGELHASEIDQQHVDTAREEVEKLQVLSTESESVIHLLEDEIIQLQKSLKLIDDEVSTVKHLEDLEYNEIKTLNSRLGEKDVQLEAVNLQLVAMALEAEKQVKLSAEKVEKISPEAQKELEEEIQRELKKEMKKEFQKVENKADNLQHTSQEDAVILEFSKRAMQAKTYEFLAESIVKSVQLMELGCLVEVIHGKDYFNANTKGADTQENKGLLKMSGTDKVIEIRGKVLINFPDVKILVLNINKTHKARYQHTTDSLTFIAEIATAQLDVIERYSAAEISRQQLKKVILAVAATAKNMETRLKAHNGEATTVMNKLLMHVNSEMSKISLTVGQQQALQGALTEGKEKFVHLYTSGATTDTSLSQLLKTLAPLLKEFSAK